MISLYNMLCCKSYLLVWLATALLYQGGTADHPPVLISLRLISPRKAILPTQVIAEDVDIQMDRIATAF